MRVIVERESTYFASANLEKPGGAKTKGCGLLPVSEKASDWLLLVPNYLVDPRKRRRRRTVRLGVWGPQHSTTVGPPGATLPPPPPLPRVDHQVIRDK